MDLMRQYHSVVLVMMFAALHPVCALDLSDYQTASYKNTRTSSAFNHFVSYNQSVYVGAIDALYHLGEDFSRQQIVDTTLECEAGIAECPNYNKILLIDKRNDRLITCGSKDGFCETRNLDAIEEVYHQGSDPVVSPGTSTTEAIIAPGAYSDDAMYVAATYIRERYGDGLYPITRRDLTSSIFNTENQLTISYRILSQFEFFIINYITSFTLDDFSYFVQSQIQDYKGIETEQIYVSKISRVCHNDEQFRSYAEILLGCQGQDSSDNYNLIQAAHIGPAGRDLAVSLGLNETDNVFYGVFAKNQGQEGDTPSNQSALCIFKLSDIDDTFIGAIAGCLRSGKYGLNYLSGEDCEQSLGVSMTNKISGCKVLLYQAP